MYLDIKIGCPHEAIHPMEYINVAHMGFHTHMASFYLDFMNIKLMRNNEI